ncbi:NEP1-interacting protein 2-like [Phragmites australis]|uniref:NEP1-interacting protein 2-like n=1 Tax=Phragmites australis TaxID=29695 RepID=UPI002D777998|nr:NEP1-interacting protein 2-like [Phragmites australis]XP_062190436.1 NEP1-interacting protein 2-like [Phragmites australis]
MDSVPSSSSSYSSWAAPSTGAAGSGSCVCIDALRTACGRCAAAAARAAGWALAALLTCVFAVVGSLVGIFIGAFIGMSTESGMFRGAGVGAISGAVFSIEAVESCIEIWRSSNSGKYSILFVLDIISSLFSGRIVWEKVSPALQRAVQSQMSLLTTPFIDNSDLFETGSTGGMSRDLISRIPKIRFSVASTCDKETDNSCCSVCLQDFGAQQFVRALPQCQHIFHVRCIDNWLLRHASCPLCRAGVHIDHIHM